MTNQYQNPSINAPRFVRVFTADGEITIDDDLILISAAPTVVIAAAFGSTTVVSDGVGNWMVI